MRHVILALLRCASARWALKGPDADDDAAASLDHWHKALDAPTREPARRHVERAQTIARKWGDSVAEDECLALLNET
jgi:hypothetical protein